MLTARHIALSAFLASLIASLHVQPALAAFGITSPVFGATELSGPPPTSVYPGVNEAGLPIIFPEVLGAVVFTPGGLPVDHNGTNVVATPTISGNVVNPAFTPATLPQGTTFNSYMLHFDPVGSPFFAFYVTTISFDNPIIGVQLFSNGFPLWKPALTPYTGTLESGDTEVFLNGGPGPPAVYYPSGVAFRGLEEDAFVLQISGNTLLVAGSANGPEVDQIRILTTISAVPELASAVTWGTISIVAFGGVFIWRRRQKSLATSTCDV